MRLERQLLYRDKKSLSEYLRGNAVNIEIHRLYNYYLNNNRDGKIQKMTEIQVLNEVYYQCAWIANINKNICPEAKGNIAYVNTWYNGFLREAKSEDFAEFISCLIVGMFSLLRKRTPVTAAFLRCLQDKFSGSVYFHKIQSQLSEFKKLFGDVCLSFSPRPVEVEKLNQNINEWRQVTNSFNQQTVMELVNRFSATEDKIAFIRILEDKAKELNVKKSVLEFLCSSRTSLVEEQKIILEKKENDDKLLAEINPFNTFLITEYADDPRKEAELLIAKEELADTQHKLAEVWEQSEEYKQAVDELKEKLGSTFISLDTIADCIMRIPDYRESVDVFKEINMLLVGTVWQTKAQDVLRQIYEKRGKDKRQIVNAERYYAPGSIHDDKGQYLTISTKSIDEDNNQKNNE